MSHVSRDRYGDKRKSGSDSKFDFNRFELYSALITWSTSKENRSESRSLSTQSEGAIFFRSRFSSDMYKDTYLNCYILLLHIIYILYLHITVYFPDIGPLMLILNSGKKMWPLGGVICSWDTNDHYSTKGFNDPTYRWLRNGEIMFHDPCGRKRAIRGLWWPIDTTKL